MYTCTTIYPLVILYMAVLRKLVHGRQDIKLQKPNTQLAPRKFPDNSPDWQILYKIGKRTTCSALPRFALTCTLYQMKKPPQPILAPPESMKCSRRISIDVSELCRLFTSARLLCHPHPVLLDQAENVKNLERNPHLQYISLTVCLPPVY